MSDFDNAPPYCNGCGHFHYGDCPEVNRDCGSYLCCNGMGDNSIDMDDMPPGQINVNGANFDAIHM